MIDPKNIFYRARMKAKEQDRLFASRERAAAAIFVSQEALYDYENGKTTPACDVVQQMVEVYGDHDLNATEMEHMAAVLHEIGEGLIVAYTTKTGKSRDEIKELLEAETYMSAQKCIDEGFADGLLQTERDAATPANYKPSSTLMRSTRYGFAAVCAMMREATPIQSPGPMLRAHAHTYTLLKPPDHCPPDPSPESPQPSAESAQREEIAKRAQLVASLYPHK